MKKNFHGIKRPAQSAPKKHTPKTPSYPIQISYMKFVKNSKYVVGVLYSNNKVRILRHYEEKHNRHGTWIDRDHRYDYNDNNQFCTKICTEKEIKSMGWALVEIIPCF